MINRSIKRKIKNNEELSTYEIIEYAYSASFSKKLPFYLGYGGTGKYMLKNFDKVLSAMNPESLKKLIASLDRNSSQRPIIQAMNNSLETLVAVMNKADKTEADEITFHLGSLGTLNYLFGEFGEKISEFYRGIDKDKYSLTRLMHYAFYYARASSNQKDAYMSFFAETLKTGNLCPNFINWYAVELKTDKKYEEFLNENAASLMECTDSPIQLLTFLQDANINFDAMNAVANTRLDCIVKELLKQNTPDLTKSPKVQEEQAKAQETLKLMLQELLAKEGCQLSDIREIGSGVYSHAYSIGTKVLKIGDKPETYEIPKQSRRFLQPIIRYNHESCYDDGMERYIHIEIAEKCDMSVPPSLEQLYQIYRELREEGIIWNDIKAENVGRLIRDNKIYFEGIDSVHAPNLGFQHENDEDILKAGEYVVLDIDFMHDENDPTIKWSYRAQEFEERYQQEQEHRHTQEINLIESAVEATEISTTASDITAQQRTMCIIQEKRNEIANNSDISL